MKASPATRSSRPWRASSARCQPRRRSRSRAASRISSISRTSPSSTIACGAGARISAIRTDVRSRGRSRKRCRGSWPSGLSPATAPRRRQRAADRARHHRPSDRDHAPDASAQVLADCRRPRRPRPAGPDAVRARGAARDHPPRDHGGLGDRGGPPRTTVAARRGPIGDGGVRGNAVGCAAAVLPIARPHAAAGDRAGAPARCRAHPVWFVDRRRPRRQSVRHTGRHTPRVPDVAVDRPDAVREGDRGPSLRALDGRRDAGAAGAGRRGVTSLIAASSGSCSSGSNGRCAWIEEQLAADNPGAIAPPPPGSTVEDAEDFAEPLRLCATARCARPATSSSPTAGSPIRFGAWPPSGSRSYGSTSVRKRIATRRRWTRSRVTSASAATRRGPRSGGSTSF